MIKIHTMGIKYNMINIKCIIYYIYNIYKIIITVKLCLESKKEKKKKSINHFYYYYFN